MVKFLIDPVIYLYDLMKSRQLVVWHGEGGGTNGKLNCCESFSCVKAAFKMKDRSSLVIHCVAGLVFVTDLGYKMIFIGSKQGVRI